MKYLLLILALFGVFACQAQTINWSGALDVAPNTNGNKYPRIVDNKNGDIFITWSGNNNVYFSKSTSSGFTAAKQLNTSAIPVFSADWTGAELAVKGDTIYVVFMHSVWKQKTYLVRSFDGGQNFSAPLLLENYADSTSRFPIVAIEDNGQPIVSFMKMDTLGNEPHYVVRRSNDYGISYYDEKLVGGVSGPGAEACDCCPAAIKAGGNKVAVFYRDNLNDIRDIYTAVSTNSGNTYAGFAVDNNNWFIQACPSSGPDGIIIGDSLYSVFLSGTKCYFSRNSISANTMNTIEQLGPTAGGTNQNFPRIDNHNNKTAIVWRGISGGTKLMFSYTNNIESGIFEIQDTLATNSFSSADVAVTTDAVHVVWQDITTGTVKYSKGTFGSSNVNDISKSIEWQLYPNPVLNVLEIKSPIAFTELRIYNQNGQVVLNKAFTTTIFVAQLAQGQYILECRTADGKFARKAFTKK